jgi:hypothetical protein
MNTIKEGIYDCSEFIYRNSALFLMVDMDKAIAELEQLFGVKARNHVSAKSPARSEHKSQEKALTESQPVLKL